MFNYDKENGKPRFEYPHLDQIVVGRRYAITINPERITSKSFTETYVYCMDMITKLLNPNVSYILRPEISTKSTMLHFHGDIKFVSAVKTSAFYFHTIPLLKDFCTFVIKPIEDHEWGLYCIKSRHMMKPYLQTCIKLPYKLIHSHTISSFIKEKP